MVNIKKIIIEAIYRSITKFNIAIKFRARTIITFITHLRYGYSVRMLFFLEKLWSVEQFSDKNVSESNRFDGDGIK